MSPVILPPPGEVRIKNLVLSAPGMTASESFNFQGEAMKQVPEENKSTVPSTEEQLRWLLNHLTGHGAFDRQRGRVGYPFEWKVKEAGSPEQFCQTWDQISADLRVLGNLLAKFNRDGWKYAGRELIKALCDKDQV